MSKTYDITSFTIITPPTTADEEIARLTSRLADQRKGEEAIRSFKLLADWLKHQGHEPHRSESNAQFVGRMLRDAIGKGEMP